VSTIDLIANGEPHGLAIETTASAGTALWVAMEAGYLWRLPVG
jgi:virginiamycin B lyase